MMNLERAKQIVKEELENIRRSHNRIAEVMNDGWRDDEINSEMEYYSAEEDYKKKFNTNEKEFASEVKKMKEELGKLDEIKEQLKSKMDKGKGNAYDIDLDNFDRMLVEFNTRLQHLEQYGRLNSALFHDFNDIPNDRSETNMVAYACMKINEKYPLQFPINPGHIDTAHLLTRRNRKNKSPILIVKFVNRWVKNAILCSENAEYGAITEHLCEQRMDLFKMAQRSLGRYKVFTDQGVVYFKNNSQVRKIRNFDDIDYFSKLKSRH